MYEYYEFRLRWHSTPYNSCGESWIRGNVQRAIVGTPCRGDVYHLHVYKCKYIACMCCVATVTRYQRPAVRRASLPQLRLRRHLDVIETASSARCWDKRLSVASRSKTQPTDRVPPTNCFLGRRRRSNYLEYISVASRRWTLKTTKCPPGRGKHLLCICNVLDEHLDLWCCFICVKCTVYVKFPRRFSETSTTDSNTLAP